MTGNNAQKITKCTSSILMLLLASFTLMTFDACEEKEEMLGDKVAEIVADSSNLADFYVGADLTYTSELEKAGVRYTLGGEEKDLFGIFKTYGANMVKLRLWNSPATDKHSNYDIFVESAKRVQSNGMSLLLDLYYSDSWTVTEKNTAPAAWTSIVNVPEQMADSIYHYTYGTLVSLKDDGIVPAAVQIGNECDDNILVLNRNELRPLKVERNVQLLNAAIKAIKDFNRKYDYEVKSVLNMSLETADVLKLMEDYKEGGLYQFDVLGVSYYPQQYQYPLENVRRVASEVYKKYGVRLLIADTGCMWTRQWKDSCPNRLDKMPFADTYAPCAQVQRHFFLDLKRVVRENFGYGVLAWEPEWVSSDKKTRWGVGSSWENATFFDFNNEVLRNGGMDFLNDDNGRMTFIIDLTEAGEGAKGYITGSFTDDGTGEWQILPMDQIGNSQMYVFKTYMTYNQSIEYYYLSDSTWNAKESFIRRYTHPYGVKNGKCSDVWDKE